LDSLSDRISSGLYGVPYTDLAPDGEWEDDSPYGQAVYCIASQYTSVTTEVTSGDRKTFAGTLESRKRHENRKWGRCKNKQLEE
jgi:hypothetical protein